MDSITHLFLGAAVAAAIAPPHRRRLALLIGAALNSVPDIDVPIEALLRRNPVDNMTWHRGPSHSLFVLMVVGLLIAAACRRWWPLWHEAPRSWFYVIVVCLLTHPLIDAFTSYGTQLFWPLPMPPVAFSSIFIIDPLFTLPLIAACIVAWRYGAQRGAKRALLIGLSVVTAYIGWSLLAKSMVDNTAQVQLREHGLVDAPRFSAPMPFTTVYWRVVVMTADGYLEGERSLIADEGPMRFVARPSDRQALHAVVAFPAMQRLLWFNQGFMKAQDADGELVVSDLRMGSEPDYAYRFVVARRDPQGDWIEIPPRSLDWPWQSSGRLRGLWSRIWSGQLDSSPDSR